MLIWIPVDGNDEENSIITTLDELKAWALVEFNDGVVEKIEFFEQRGTEERFVEFISCQKSIRKHNGIYARGDDGSCS